MSRLARAAWLTLALLSLFTISAGVAVAHLLPPRLALWRLPTVAGHPLAVGVPVLGPATGTAAGGAATPAGVAAALSAGLGSAALGPDVAAVVTDLSTGRVLFSQNGSAPFTPASTAKLAVAVAASFRYRHLEPDHPGDAFAEHRAAQPVAHRPARDRVVPEFRPLAHQAFASGAGPHAAHARARLSVVRHAEHSPLHDCGFCGIGA